jgi:CHASE3 domain sensor protein
MDRDIRMEIYLSLLVLGAEPMLLGAVSAWRDGVEERDILADLRNWNDAKVLEMKEWLPTMSGTELQAVQERIRQYEQAREELEKAA